MRIQIIRTADDGLARDEWVFDTYYLPDVRLAEYFSSARSSKRHRKWTTILYYSAFSPRPVGALLISEPTPPDDVIAEALQQLRDAIHFRGPITGTEKTP